MITSIQSSQDLESVIGLFSALQTREDNIENKINDNLEGNPDDKIIMDNIDELYSSLKSFFANKNKIISVYSKLRERKTKSADQTTTDKTVKRKRQPFDLERLLKKASSPKWKPPTDKKWDIITDFYVDVKSYKMSFPLLFLVVNHRFINENSLERVSYLFERHSSEKAVRIIETFPIVLGCSLERTKSIYQFLDSRHGKEQTNPIVETLPSVLGYSLARTKQIYEEMDKKVSNGAEYIAQFPLILYCSVKLVKKNNLKQLLEIVRKIEERHNWRERSMIDDNENNITDRLQYEEFREEAVII